MTDLRQRFQDSIWFTTACPAVVGQTESGGLRLCGRDSYGAANVYCEVHR